MKKVTFVIILFLLASKAMFAQSKFEQDRQAILSLGGFYKVNFAYTETFAPDTAYHFYPQYHTSGYEWAIVQEDSPNKIVIQHILLTGDSSVIKHWREDWVYEENILLAFDKNNTWKKVKLAAGDEKGRWVQKVYQVDDSPRYESIGTWMHVDGRHEWQSQCDSPLPRREYTKRGDYDVLKRGNRIYLTAKGWMFEQDNQKIIRSAAGDRLLVREKGYEEFTKVDRAKFAYAQGWWVTQQPYWNIVRKVWDEVYAENSVIKIKARVDGKPLYEKLFDLADQSVTAKWDAGKSRAETLKMIKKYLDTSI
jgi:hypothetical protein